MELKFVQNQTDETVDVLIHGRIGVDPRTGRGIDGARFASEMAFLDSLDFKQINIPPGFKSKTMYVPPKTSQNLNKR